MTEQLGLLVKELIGLVGTRKRATMVVVEILDCSISKAEKITSGRYQSEISQSERTVLAARIAEIRSKAQSSLARGKGKAS